MCPGLCSLVEPASKMNLTSFLNRMSAASALLPASTFPGPSPWIHSTPLRKHEQQVLELLLCSLIQQPTALAYLR